MSKSSLISGDTFQLYEESFDDGFVYLEVSQMHFEASPHAVRLRIPIEIWETVRHHGGPDLSLLDLTEDELKDTVERAVDARMRAYREGSATALLGGLAFGGADSPRAQQIANGLTAYREEIEKLRKVSAAIAALSRPTVSQDVNDQ